MNGASTVQLVAVVGGSGAGKGWLIARLCQLLGEDACHLQLDDFYRDRSHLPPGRRARVNFDVPQAIDWEWAARVLRDCRSGRSTTLPCYDFATYSRIDRTTAWTPRPIVLVDGLWLLRPPAVRALFHLKIFLDTPPKVRCTRRLARDVAERGYTRDTVERQLRTAVVPMHERYVEPQKKWADLVLAHPFVVTQLAALADRLCDLLERGAPRAARERPAFREELTALLTHHESCN
jgi:uridine kinase